MADHSEDSRWLAAALKAAGCTVAELARVTGIRQAELKAIEAGAQELSAAARFRIRAVCLARVEERAGIEERRAQEGLSKRPGLVAAVAFVDPGTLAAAMVEAERRRRTGEDVTYELVLGEWAARPR